MSDFRLILKMKIDWKSLSLAFISSMILNGIAGTVVLIDYNERMSNIFDVLDSENYSDDKISITIAKGNSLSYWIWIVIFVFSFIISTIIVYFVINHMKKRKG